MISEKRFGSHVNAPLYSSLLRGYCKTSNLLRESSSAFIHTSVFVVSGELLLEITAPCVLRNERQVVSEN